MERRWTTRTNLNLDVDVAYGEGEVIGCTTRDIGLGGVFVATGKSALPPGENVELTFRLGQVNDDPEYRIRAKVVRHTDDGAGLMFRDFDATAFRALQKVMRFKESSAVS
jgi:hypothetical protein